MMKTDDGKAALAGKKSFDLKQIKLMLRRMMNDAWEIAQQVKPDMVVYHPKPLAGYHIADKLGVPGILAIALPVYSPTGDFSNPILGGGDYGSLLNRLSYTLFLKASLLPYRGFINRWRKEQLDLPPFHSQIDLKLVPHINQGFEALLGGGKGDELPMIEPQVKNQAHFHQPFVSE